MIALDYELRDGTRWVHIRAKGVFGHARELRDRIMPGTLVSIPPDLQPAVSWYLQRHAGFVFVGHELHDSQVYAVLAKGLN